MSNRKSRQLRQRTVSVRHGRKKYITLGAIGLMVTVSLGTVDAVRAAANLSAAAWTDSTLKGGLTVKAVHLQELRTNLDQALSALGVSLDSYTDSSPADVTIKKVHIDEIRQRVK